MNNNPEIERKIESFQKDISLYRTALKENSIWLFLATLGCINITSYTLQLIALTITALIFFSRLYNQAAVKRSFKNLKKDIQIEIKQLKKDEYVHDWEVYLRTIKKLNLGFFNHVVSNWIFIIVALFYGIAVYYIFFTAA